MPLDKFQIDGYNQEDESLLEYVVNVANVFAPDIVIDNGVPYKCDSQAPLIFRRRYNNDRLNVYFSYKDYIKVRN